MNSTNRLSALLGTETTVTKPVPGVVTGRRHKVSGITTSRSDLFKQLLAGGPSTTGDERSFSVRPASARRLSVEQRLGLLQRRRVLVVERLPQLARRAKQPLRHRYVQLVVEPEQESLSRGLSWLDPLIQGKSKGVTRPVRQAGGTIGLGVPLASTTQLRRGRATKALARASEYRCQRRLRKCHTRIYRERPRLDKETHSLWCPSCR